MKVVEIGFFQGALVKYVCLLFCWTIVSCSAHVIRSENMPEHHTATGFRNYPLVPTSSSKGPLFVLRRIWGSAFHPDVPDDHIISEQEAIDQLTSLKDSNTITWLGQSTFLLRVNGQTILTDPFLTNRASPVSFLGGVTRYTQPGISIEKLPPIDIIIVSHNHYDHLDFHTINSLPNKRKIKVAVPLGLSSIFFDSGYKDVHEMDWNERVTFNGIQLASLPAVHDSGRWLIDKDKSLWCSWAIVTPSRKYYFGGDTGYSSVFKDIGEEFLSFDLAILPIGAYEPNHLMWMSHVTPEEAVKVGLDINASVLVAGHWGTIELSDEPHWEPPKRFIAAAEKVGMGDERAWIMKIGETRALP